MVTTGAVLGSLATVKPLVNTCPSPSVTVTVMASGWVPGAAAPASTCPAPFTL